MPAKLDRTVKWMISLSLALFLLCMAVASARAGAEPVTICILDSGCNLSSAEGWNYLDDSAAIEDPVGHGTAIYTLLTSCAPDAVIYSLKCFESEESFDEEAVIRALTAAVEDYEADIICMSWTVNAPREALKEAIEFASESGAVLLAPAGNLSLSTGLGTVVYPAAWDEVIGIGGVNLDENSEPVSSLWYLSNESVYVCARGDFGEEKGSSYSVPRIAATIALHLADHPDDTAEDILAMLRDAAQDLGDPGYDTVYGWGYIESEW